MTERDEDLMLAIGEAMGEPGWMSDERVERIAAGVATEQEVEELRRVAADYPDFDEFIAALSPTGGDLEDALAGMVARSASGGEEAGSPGERPVTSLDERRRSRRMLKPALLIGGPIAAAAGILLAVSTLGRGAPLTGYEMELVGGEKAFRSAKETDPSGPVVLEGGSRLVIRLRPAAATGEEVAISGFLFEECDAPSKVLSIPFEVSRSGTVVMEGRASELFGDARGDRTLVIVLHRQGEALGEAGTLAELEERAEDMGAMLFTTELELIR